MANFVDIEPHSPSHRVGLYLASNPGVSLPRPDVASMLRIAPAAVDRALMPAVDQGVIAIANDGHDGRVWRPGPRMQQWIASLRDQPPAPAPRPAVPTVARSRKDRLPPLDIKALPVVADAPVPTRANGGKGTTRYDDLLDKLTADGMAITTVPVGMAITTVPVGYRGAMGKAVQLYLRNRPQLAAKSSLVLRTVSKEHFGIWRLPKAQAEALCPPRAPRKPTTTTAKA